ncbi:DNA-binding protein [Paenibacillus spiritus]|uniref:DNA-binding protein n=1 Tax=Paenibacillus spiritus TaxID=2496557 RepID=A0A5J5FSQ9_9BACL|nr:MULTISPECIES: DNA-binding protein [Paenibacillus]KAA8995416.1 DNA-binding protein [Paenibacillus spiritus]
MTIIYSNTGAGLETPDLREMIEAEMARQGIGFGELAQRSSINRGIFSATFNRNPPKPLSIRQVDLMTEALGQPEGWLYDLFALECFEGGGGHWKRIKSFMVRCVDLDREDLIESVLSRLMEEPSHTVEVFELAENLFEEGRRKASIPFYRCVAENEIKQHSERLAVSQYKWFRARLGSDLQLNREAALQYAPFRRRVPENYQLDGLLQLANISFNLHQWEDVIGYADELHALMKAMMANRQHLAGIKSRRPAEPLRTERHLVVYYGQSYLLKGNALEWLGRFEESLAYIDGYEDLGWFPELDETGWREVEKFKLFAEANRYNLYILMGHTACLPDYVRFLDRHPQEWLPSLLTIMGAANRYQFDVDAVLDHFDRRLHDLSDSLASPGSAYYQPTFNRDRQAHLCYELAVYHAYKGRSDTAIDYALQSLTYALPSSNHSLAITCMAWFEQFREQASQGQLAIYQDLMKGVIGHAQIPEASTGHWSAGGRSPAWNV